MSKKRNFYRRGALAHVCQRAKNKFVVFYNVKDSLAFFTVLCIAATHHKVRISGLCLMFNHIHINLEADSDKSIRSFVRDFCTWFSRKYNSRYGLKGTLFDRHALSNKWGSKDIRSALAYLYNNPVEDRICKRAEEWRWNFLAYAESKNPYSEKLVLAKSSAKMRRAVEGVKFYHNHFRPLLWFELDSLLDPLDSKEKNQLTDFIIRTYSVIDFERAISFYGSYEMMTKAFSYTSGSEHKIRNEYDHCSGLDYKILANRFACDKRFQDIRDYLGSPFETKIDYLNFLMSCCKVKERHARRFLHIRDADRRDKGTDEENPEADSGRGG